MNKLIETFKRNELLEAQYYQSIAGKDMCLYDMLGVVRDIPSHIGQLIFGKYRLVLTYNYPFALSGLSFSSIDEQRNYINNNIDDVFVNYVQKYDDYIFTLNISSTFASICPSRQDELKYHFDVCLSLFSPIIQKFMVDALTDNLYIMENGELVKQ